jgi:glutamate/tyrosine decarboxylase-like PLP-dependent enzyme
VATVGTTSSGAIDSIGEIGEVGKFHIIDTAEADKSVKDFPSCYLHIDSAVSTTPTHVSRSDKEVGRSSKCSTRTQEVVVYGRNQ